MCQAEQETTHKLKDRLIALDEKVGAGCASDGKASDHTKDDEEAKIKARLRDLGYVEE